MNRWSVVALLACLCIGCSRSEIKPDEEVLFFPTYAYEVPAESEARQMAEFHAWVYQPVGESAKRRALLALLRKSLGLDPGEADTERFNARAKWFLVDSESGRDVRISLLLQVFDIGRTDETGHVRSRIACGAMYDPMWHSFDAALPEGDSRAFVGFVVLLPREGVSVVSDIDDTIKISNVRDRKALIRNTFLEEYKAVPGMRELYGALAMKGASFHYVSASPWQLYPALDEFVVANRFPLGTWHLRDFSLGHSEFFNLFESPEKYKPAVIEPLLARFPNRKFILVGDSGEKDPEIYGEIARKHPNRVVGIFIRNVTGEAADAERYIKAFEGVSRETWAVFTDPAEVRDGALRLLK